jgi:hypothetical protein
MFIYFMAIWSILWRFGIFYHHLVHFSGFGITNQEKSGNPALSLWLADPEFEAVMKPTLDAQCRKNYNAFLATRIELIRFYLGIFIS